MTQCCTLSHSIRNVAQLWRFLAPVYRTGSGKSTTHQARKKGLGWVRSGAELFSIVWSRALEKQSKKKQKNWKDFFSEPIFLILEVYFPLIALIIIKFLLCYIISSRYYIPFFSSVHLASGAPETESAFGGAAATSLLCVIRHSNCCHWV